MGNVCHLTPPLFPSSSHLCLSSFLFSLLPSPSLSLSVSLPRMCPIFQVSNVTGENMDLLKMFLNLLSSKTSYREDEPAEFQIDDTYSVPVGPHTQPSTPHTHTL